MSRHRDTASGKLGTAILYTINGKQFGRSMPGKGIRQSAATQKRSSAFAIAAKLASAATRYMVPVFKLKDSDRYRRLTGAFSKWLGKEQLMDKAAGTIPGLLGFNINPPKFGVERWTDQLQVTNAGHKLIIRINALVPKEMMAKRKDIAAVQLTICSVAITRSAVNYAVKATESILIPFNKELFAAQTIVQDLNMPAGSVILTGYAIEYFKDDSSPVIMRKGYNPPAKIIYAEWRP